jgi:hypothetical protein
MFLRQGQGISQVTLSSDLLALRWAGRCTGTPPSATLAAALASCMSYRVCLYAESPDLDTVISYIIIHS